MRFYLTVDDSVDSSSSPPKDGWESSLHVAQVASNGRSRAGLGVVGRPEFFLFIVIKSHLASERFLWILFVVGERCKGLVVADTSRVRWPEGPLVLSYRSSRGLELPCDHYIGLFEDRLMRVEGVGLLSSLREWFVLQHAMMVLTFGLCELLRPVKIVLDVRSGSAEEDKAAVSTSLHWHGQDVARRNHDLSRVLIVTVIFLNLNEVVHVRIGRLHSVLHMTLILEWPLVATSDLNVAVLLPPQDVTVDLNVRVSDASVAGM